MTLPEIITYLAIGIAVRILTMDWKIWESMLLAIAASSLTYLIVQSR